MKHPKFIVQIALESYTRYRHKYQTWWNRFNISEKEFNNNTFKIDVKSVVFWEFLAIKCFLKMPNYMIKLIIVKSRKKKMSKMVILHFFEHHPFTNSYLNEVSGLKGSKFQPFSKSVDFLATHEFRLRRRKQLKQVNIQQTLSVKSNKNRKTTLYNRCLYP